MTRLARALRNEGCVAAACALIVALVQWVPALKHPLATGFGDWQMIHHNWEAARVAVSRFSEWPLWDPFHCGGVTILGNPESQVYTPLFLLSFVLGSVLASKLMLVLHAACALFGMYLLARRHYALGPAAAALAAVVWSLSGFFAWQLAGGHVTFVSFVFAPLLVLCFRGSATDHRYAVLLALLLGLTLFEGGTYPFPYFMLLLAFELGCALAQRRASTRLARNLLIAGFLSLTIGAIRLVPIAVTLADTPRTTPSTDSLGLSDVLAMLTAREHAWRVPPHPYGWSEYATYIGYAALGLALLGAGLCVRRGPRHLLAGAVLFGLLMLGSRAPYYPWPLLRALPVYDSLRVPSRFAVLFTFYLALLAAVAFERIGGLWAGRARALWLLAPVLVLAQAIDMLSATHFARDLFQGPPIYDRQGASDFYLVTERNYDAGYASYPQRNVGTRLCYIGGMHWKVSPALWNGRVAQARVWPQRAGRVVQWLRSTRRLQAVVELTRPAALVWNQNYAPGWETNTGTLREERGLLAIELPAGHHSVELTYAPSCFVPSLAVSAVGIVIALWLLGRKPRAVWGGVRFRA